MKTLITAIAISSALLTGCASTNHVTEDKYSGFLDNYSILHHGPNDSETMLSVTQGINWSKYDSVMIDKVQIILPDGQKKTEGKIAQAIADKYEELIRDKASKKFKVVNQPSETTVRIQPAITSIFTSHDDLKGYQYIPIAAAATTASRTSGLSKKSVRVMTEVKLIDSIDNQLLLQGVDLKAGKELQNEQSGILVADVLPILVQWSERLMDKLDTLKQAVNNS